GEQGRIAEIGPDVVLDAAAGTSCRITPDVLPCGTSRDLTAAAIAPEGGSALVGGDGMTILWRPGGGPFRAVTKPNDSLLARVTAISMPTADTAYVTTDSGRLFRGTLEGSDWSWTIEDIDEGGDLLTLKPGANTATPLNAIAVDANGHGY